jgi:hypothetical protein
MIACLAFLQSADAASFVRPPLFRPETVDLWIDPRTFQAVALSLWQCPSTQTVERPNIITFGSVRCGVEPKMQPGQSAPNAFDKLWRDRLNLAAKVIRDVQDFWLRSSLPFPSQSAAAVLFQILAAGGASRIEVWRRSTTEWFSSVSDAESECARLSPAAVRATCAVVAARACEILDSAAESWENISPLEPTCEVVVRQVFDLLVAHRFARA